MSRASSRWTVPASSRRYALATLVTLAMLGASVLLLPLGGNATYTPLVVAAAISVWYGGLGPGLLSIVLGWLGGAFFLARPRFAFDVTPSGGLVRWLIPLVAAMVIVWAGAAMRGEGRRAGARAELAERSRGVAEVLHALAATLSAAVTPSDVARALVEQMPSLLGARGGALGIVYGDELRIVDPEGAPQQTLAPGARLPLSTLAPITTAARTGEPAYADTRAELERAFPDGARLAGAEASGALAVPLVVDGRVIGAMGFPFVGPHAIGREMVALAQLAAALGARALERAGLYGEERAAREGLERIARLAPLFAAASPAEIAAAVCREARDTLGADVAQIWSTVDRETFAVTWRDPPADLVPPGATIAFHELPGLRRALDRVETMFVSDAQRELQGQALAHAVALGVHSSLRVPIAIGGTAQRVLVFQWERVVAEPSPAMLLLARRLADQAGLALEHAERRLAESAEHAARTRAERMASDLAQLHVLSTRLARSFTAADIAELVTAQIVEVAGAEVGGIYLVGAGTGNLELLELRGEGSEAVREHRERVPLDSDLPLARAIRDAAPLWLPGGGADLLGGESPGDRPAHELGVVPLVVERQAIGAVFAVFPAGSPVDEERRHFVETVARQAAHPLEHATLLERERSSRVAAEQANERTRRLQVLTGALAASATASEVGAAVVREGLAAIAADTAVLYQLDESARELRVLASAGYSAEAMDGWERVPLDADAPVADVVRSGEVLELGSATEILDRYGYLEKTLESTGDQGALCTPLAIGERILGVLYLGFRSERRSDAEGRALVETISRLCAQALERGRLFDEELVSRRRSERLQSLTAALSGSLTSAEVADVFLDLARVAVGAQGAAIGVVDEEGRAIRVLGSRGYDDGVLDGWLEVPLEHDAPAVRAFRRMSPLYYGDRDSLLRDYPALEPGLGLAADEAFAFVPLSGGRRSLGVGMLSWRRPVQLPRREQTFLETIANQCGQALDRARRYESERVIAETLQRSVLPESLPAMEGVQVAARYLPGAAAVDVGGDWYDTISLAGGLLGFVVGDVVGKGVKAAATMAQLRNGMRALALDSRQPGRTITKLNRLLEGYAEAPFATLAYVVLDPGSGVASVVSAGHLPPLVVSPAGVASYLEGGRGLPLGVDANTVYEQWSTMLEPGSMLVLYTDGLVERRDRPLDEGLEHLARSATRASREPEQFADAILTELVGGRSLGDDLALLAVRLDASRLEPLDLRVPADQSSLPIVREALSAWLERAAIPGVDARDIVLATWEAGANAIEHAIDPAADSIALRATLSGDRLRLEVTDSGRWKEPESRAGRGLGIRLMQSLMSSFDIERGRSGTRVVMERVLSRERARDHAIAADSD